MNREKVYIWLLTVSKEMLQLTIQFRVGRDLQLVGIHAIRKKLQNDETGYCILRWCVHLLKPGKEKAIMGKYHTNESNGG